MIFHNDITHQLTIDLKLRKDLTDLVKKKFNEARNIEVPSLSHF